MIFPPREWYAKLVETLHKNLKPTKNFVSLSKTSINNIKDLEKERREI